MYMLQEKPDEKIIMDNDEIAHPVATLADEYGGRAQVVVDDHCYVLHLKQEDGRYKHTAWWFREAVEALRQLPTNPTDAEIPVLRRVMGDKKPPPNPMLPLRRLQGIDEVTSPSE